MTDSTRPYLRRIIWPVILLVVLLASCASWSTPTPPLGADSPLPVREGTSYFSVGSATYRALAQVDVAKVHRLHSVLVGIDGEIVLERYYNRRDEGSIHDIRSATKSITAILVGIAIDRGIVSGVDQPVAEILQPAYPDIEIPEDLTIHHLLSMSPGKDCDDWDRRSPGNENRMYRTRDWTEFFLSLDQVAAPGEVGSYCTGGVVALGRILELSLDTPLDDWADEVLFKPLGIRNYQWEYYQRGRGVDTGGHLHISPRGLMALGFMLLQRGSFAGERIVSAEWIDDMWTPRGDLSGQMYGYLWWPQEVDYGFGPVQVLVARGNGGQNLFLVPSLSLSVVVTTGYYNDPRSAVSDQIFFNAILPDVLDIDSASGNSERKLKGVYL
jgi:CubicO group peptidase (beta-lactamase class C family)